MSQCSLTRYCQPALTSGNILTKAHSHHFQLTQLCLFVVLTSPASLHRLVTNLVPAQLRDRGQPNHLLPADPRLHGPDQQVRHLLPAAAAPQRVDVRRHQSQQPAGL